MPFNPTALQLTILRTLDLLQNNSVELLSPKWKPTGDTFRFVYGVPDWVVCAAVKSDWNSVCPELPPLFSRKLIERKSEYVAWMTGRETRFRGIVKCGVVARWTLIAEMDMLRSIADRFGTTVKKPRKTRTKKKPSPPPSPSCVLEQVRIANPVGTRMRLSAMWERTHTTRKLAHLTITNKGLELLDELGAKWEPDVLLTLTQIATYIGRNKRTMERWLRDELIPQPDVHGGGGRPHLWYWRSIREDLEEYSKRPLPHNFPGP